MWRYFLGFVLIWTLILGAFCPNPGIWAQPVIWVESNRHEVAFRDHIRFQLTVRGETDIEEVTLFYRVADQPAVTHVSPEFTIGDRVTAEYTWDLTDGPLPPGVQVTYWWRVSDGEGHTLETDPQSLLYTDDRYDWHTLSSGQLSLYWYRGDEHFGRALFDKAQEALDTLGREMGVTVTRPVKVFIYGSHADLLGAIAEGAKEWTGGQAFPEVGVVVIGVSPTDLAWGQRAVAHELTHLVVHQMIDTPLGELPRWLDEGLAMYAEGELEPSYQRALAQAVREGHLITLRSLSSSFPTDSKLAHLSYAQSYSLVEFILEEHGREAMSQLLRIFAEGAYQDDALKEALGLDVEGLDAAWRKWVEARLLPHRSATPLPLQRIPLARPVLWGSVGLCCVGGMLLVAAVGGLLMFARRS